HGFTAVAELKGGEGNPALPQRIRSPRLHRRGRIEGSLISPSVIAAVRGRSPRLHRRGRIEGWRPVRADAAVRPGSPRLHRRGRIEGRGRAARRIRTHYFLHGFTAVAELKGRPGPAVFPYATLFRPHGFTAVAELKGGEGNPALPQRIRSPRLHR